MFTQQVFKNFMERQIMPLIGDTIQTDRLFEPDETNDRVTLGCGFSKQDENRITREVMSTMVDVIGRAICCNNGIIV